MGKVLDANRRFRYNRSMENTGKGFGLRILNRYYLRTWRRRSIRQWRRLSARQRRPGIAALRYFLLICAGAGGIFLLVRDGGLKYLADQAIRVRYIEDSIPQEKTGSAPGSQGDPGNIKVKEGISILLDEGSVNIFRVEEYMENPR